MKEEHMTITLKAPGQATQQPVPASAPVQKRTKKWGKRIFLVIVTLVVIALVFFACFFAYNKFKQPSSTTSDSETSQVVAEVGKLMLLPNETPTVAVVSDLAKLQGQKFFTNAKEGDVVLMYAQAQKAILYSPTDNKIIEVAPIVNDQPQQ